MSFFSSALKFNAGWMDAMKIIDGLQLTASA
jgi:hypothetical protein